MMRTSLFLAFVLAACSESTDGASQDASTPGLDDGSTPGLDGSTSGVLDGSTPGLEDGLAAFETVRAVLQHPRCQNCHPAGDAPLQGNDSHPHKQFVQRGPTGHGMAGAECTACHGPANPPDSYGAAVPPGVVVGWHMPGPELPMVFVGLSPGALCEQIKDPARNGGRDMAALRAHVNEDPLVLWAWDPGFGRDPVSTPHAEFMAAVDAWASAGAPCPAD